MASRRIYTRKGDDGTSSTLGDAAADADGGVAESPRSKSDALFYALGSIDELHADIGVARQHCLDRGFNLAHALENIQCLLLLLGSHVASSRPASTQSIGFDEDGQALTDLEQVIDGMTASLPPLRNFLILGGGPASAALHVAQTTCRRAERNLVALHSEGACAKSALKFMNRLSDFLFTAARYAAHSAGVGDEPFGPERRQRGTALVFPFPSPQPRPGGCGTASLLLPLLAAAAAGAACGLIAATLWARRR